MIGFGFEECFGCRDRFKCRVRCRVRRSIGLVSTLRSPSILIKPEAYVSDARDIGCVEVTDHGRGYYEYAYKKSFTDKVYKLESEL